MVVNYDEMRRIYRLEKNTTRLIPIEDDFYNQLHEFVIAEKKAFMDSISNSGAPSENKEFVNLKRIVQEWFLMRQKKILNQSLISVRTGDAPTAGMAKPEVVLFETMVQTLQAHHSLLEALFSMSGKSLPAASLETAAVLAPELSILDVKIVAEVSSFVGFDSKEYGPYEPGSHVELPYKIAKLLIGRKLAELE